MPNMANAVTCWCFYICSCLHICAFRTIVFQMCLFIEIINCMLYICTVIQWSLRPVTVFEYFLVYVFSSISPSWLVLACLFVSDTFPFSYTELKRFSSVWLQFILACLCSASTFPDCLHHFNCSHHMSVFPVSPLCISSHVLARLLDCPLTHELSVFITWVTFTLH